MLGITAFAAWEFLTGHPIVENSMFFHPNALLPALLAAYVAFNTFYELDDSETFLRFKLSSEGEARMANLKLGRTTDKDAESVDVMEMVDKASAFFSGLGDKYEQAQQAYMENVVKMESSDKTTE